MKVYSRETLVKRLKICMVLGAIVAVLTTVITFVAPLFLGLEEFTIGALLICVYGILCAPVYAFSFLSMSFNFGKIMLGMIAPVPIVSMFIETFKSLYYGVKAIIVIVKKRDELVIGHPVE